MEHVPNNPFFAANATDIPRLEAYMDELRKAGDSCGARIDVMARNVPVGLGEPLFDKLDADIALRDDGHQRGQGRRDRRRLSRASRSAARRTATS